MKHLISSQQFSHLDQLFPIFEEANFHQGHYQSLHALDKIMATLFYQPSTRTRFSFEAAMHRLGGRVISSENPEETSSQTKGESLLDTIKTVSIYADVIILRHSMEYAASQVVKNCNTTLINAGDGANEHPTQALLDLYTIWKEIGRLEDFHIALVGDLKFGRTIHSLFYLFPLLKNIRITLCSPPHLQVLDYDMQVLEKYNIPHGRKLNLEEVLNNNPDVIYMTRSQKAVGYADEFCLNKKNLHLVPEKAIILHPMPRNNEIDLGIDNDPRACYFRQVRNGLFIRMAILNLVFRNKISWDNYVR